MGAPTSNISPWFLLRHAAVNAFVDELRLGSISQIVSSPGGLWSVLPKKQNGNLMNTQKPNSSLHTHTFPHILFNVGFSVFSILGLTWHHGRLADTPVACVAVCPTVKHRPSSCQHGGQEGVLL